MVELENPSAMTASATSAEASNVSSYGVDNQIPPKKKRNLPGMPDPDAEVIALSPKTLMATNRFVCEICSKGFQRDQNLQLHRRGHNLPWKLKQRTSKEIRKRVYVCPESACVHHDPSRALGDLTGIKKHFCRKHGEKKWKCERCSKKYAVQSDWKAHMKTCGTREYRCDCGTLFSRRDSFITHRAFCDALAQESERSQTLAVPNSDGNLMVEAVQAAASPPPPPLTPSTGVLSPVLSIQSSDLPENPPGVSQPPVASTCPATATPKAATATSATTASASSTSSGSGNVSRSSGVFASIFASSAPACASHSSQTPSSYSDLLCAMAGSERTTTEPMSLSLSSSLYLSSTASLFPTSDQDHRRQYAPSPQPALSATALLQKAAQMGATASNSSFLRGLGFTMSPSIDHQENTTNNTTHWSTHATEENRSGTPGLGLRLPSDGVVPNYPNLIMGQSSLFPNKPTTLDLLGLGIGPAGGGPSDEFSDFLTSMSGGLDVSGASFGVNSAGENWEDAGDRKPELL
ncbi:hypothetical protein LguiB_017215 [Lonicera macranthoides]